MGIYNTTPKMEDELYVSYLLRTAAVNGFEGNERFFFDNRIYSGSLNWKTVGSDICMPWTGILDFSSQDPFAEFRDMTLFNVIAPLTERNRLQGMICDAFYNPKYGHNFPRTTVQRGKCDVRVCPACARMEISEHGFYWLHRKHNVPGIGVCHIHGCRLIDIDFPYLNHVEAVLDARPVEEPDPVCRKTAHLAAWFLDNAPDVDLDDIRGIIRNRVLGKEGGLERTVNGLVRESDGRITRPQIESLVSTAGGNNSKRHPLPETVLTLLALLSDPEEITAAGSAPRPEEGIFREYAAGRGYELIGEYRRNLLSLIHRECGTLFPSTPYALSNGWMCPECGAKLSREELVRHVFDTVSAGEYEMLGEYPGNDGRLMLRHVCGRTFSVSARAFMFENAQCPCKRIFSPAAADRMIPFVTGGKYSLLRPYNPFDRTVTAGHDCGYTGRYNLARFLAGERCPVCSDIRNEPVDQKAVQRERKLEFFRKRAAENERSLVLLDELRKRYRQNDLILSEETGDDPETRGRLTALVEDGRLVKYGPGAYALEGSTLTFEDVIERRYLGDIGYLYGDAFAYQLGLSSKPDVLVVVSNKAGNAIGRTVVYKDGIVVLKRARIPLDRTNVVMMSVFDFLPFLGEYDGSIQRVREYMVSRLGDLPELSEFDRLIARYGSRSRGRYQKLIRLVYGGSRCAMYA